MTWDELAKTAVLDLPTGAAIVATFGLALLVLADLRALLHRPAAA